MEIQKRKSDLKLKSAEDLEGTLFELKTQLSFTSNLFNDYILIQGRFKDIKDAYSKDTVARFDRNIEQAKIRGSLLELIDKLTIEDLETLEKNIVEIIDLNKKEFEDDLGFYDYLEIAENGFVELTESTTKLATFTSDFGNNITEQANKISILNESGKSGESKARTLKKLFKDTAVYFKNYNSHLEEEISIFKRTSSKSLDAFYKAVEFYYANNLQNENEEELLEVYESVVLLEESSGEARIGFMSMYTSVKQLPRFQKELNRAKRITEKHLRELLQELEDYRNKTREFKDYLELNLKKE